jgi:hypothetical protein
MRETYVVKNRSVSRVELMLQRDETVNIKNCPAMHVLTQSDKSPHWGEPNRQYIEMNDVKLSSQKISINAKALRQTVFFKSKERKICDVDFGG